MTPLFFIMCADHAANGRTWPLMLFFAGEDNRRSTEAALAPRIIKKTVMGDALSVWRKPGEVHLEKSYDKSEVP